MKEKYLPIGTVVLLKDAEKELMIVGFSAIDEDDDEIYDYIGCPYPEGLMDTEEVELFKHEQIEEILYTGYVTDASNKYSEEVRQITDEYLSDDVTSEENNENIEVL